MKTDRILGLFAITTVIVTLVLGLAAVTEGAKDSQGPLIGYVDMEALQKDHPLMVKAKELSGSGDKQVQLIKAQVELDKTRAFQDMEAELQEKLKAAKTESEQTMTKNMYEQLLKAKYQEIELKANMKMQEMANGIQKQIKELVDAVKEQVTRIGKQKNVDLVMQKDVFLYAKNSLDLTADVVKLGKDEAEKEKAKKEKDKSTKEKPAEQTTTNPDTAKNQMKKAS
ncbi:MAG: OmpH family outer membrane protein [Bacillota bacterium]